MWSQFASQPPLLLGFAVIVGLLVGSFLNVVIVRLPRMMELEWRRDCAEVQDAVSEPSAPFDLARPPSHCPACGHSIRAWENIPILSYLWLRGRCAACAVRIPLRYPLIEALTALLTLIVVWHFGWSMQMAAALVFTWALIALAVIDFYTKLLPDVITLPLVWLGLILSLFGVFVDSETAIIGAVSGYGSFWLLFHLYRLFTGKEGMGRGDFKLFALFGAWMGWAALPQIVLLSALPGAIVGIGLMVTQRQEHQTPIPFGPFLAIAGWISLLWGEAIIQNYLQLV